VSKPASPFLRHPFGVLTALLLALGVVLSFVWRGPAAPARDATATNPSTADAARAAIGTDAAGASGAATAPTQPQTRAAPAAPTTRPPHVARGTPSPARDAYERARSLGALFNALHTQSDPETLFFAQRALRDCLPYIRAATQAGQPPALDRYRPAPPDDPMTSRRKAAYETLQGRCSGFDLGADPAATEKALRDALAVANDPRATLEQAAGAVRRGGAPEDALNQVKAATANGDPYALEQASAVMSAMRGRYVFVLDGQVVKPDIVAAGWMMAACDAGRSCGEEWVQAPCAFLTECDARDLESSLQRYQLTPSEFDAMQQVRARVMRGVAGGPWDAALFAPQPAPPGYRRWGP
jgi:hypothetical protein